MMHQWGHDIVEQAGGLPAFLAATEPVAPRGMLDLIPAFDWQKVVVAPWTVDIGLYGWMMLMAFLVTTACGLIGNYLLLRRLALRALLWRDMGRTVMGHSGLLAA